MTTHLERSQSDGFEFVLAEHADIPEIVGVYHSLVGTPGCTWDFDYPSRKTAEADVGSNSLYVLKKDGRIIAVASAGDFQELGHLPWSPEKPCELARIGVLPAMQRQGIGSILLQHIIRAAEEKGYDGIRMLVSKTNPAALAMYEKNGFARCGEAFLFGIDFYCYQMKFAP